MNTDTLRPASAVTPVPTRLIYVPGGVDCPECEDGICTEVRGFREPSGHISAHDRTRECRECGGLRRLRCVWCPKPADGRIVGPTGERDPVCEPCGHEIEREGA